MTGTDPKADLHHYLRDARTAVVWKLDGLSEYDARRPLTPTGTNLLGLVKHLTSVELLYFGWAFDRPFPRFVPWFRPDLPPEEAPPNADKWATPEESRAYILGTYADACRHADATIEALDLDALGTTPWLIGGPHTLHRLLTHVIAECHRHAGHADIVRELIDGTAGLAPDIAFLPSGEAGWWAEYRDRVEKAAVSAPAEASPSSGPDPA